MNYKNMFIAETWLSPTTNPVGSHTNIYWVFDLFWVKCDMKTFTDVCMFAQWKVVWFKLHQNQRIALISL